ncbi:MAG: hypothetical protein ACXWID_00120 [Pyrinomonadaceae bacterium]
MAKNTTPGTSNPKVEIPLMIKDPTVTAGGRGVDQFHCTLESEYWDGPVSNRVAVLDFDDQTGELRPGAKFIPAPPKRALGRFDVPRRTDPKYPKRKDYVTDTDPFIQTSVFGTVLRTIKLFEHENVLGRPVRWAFDGPQLLVIPRAADWANAFYHRDSRSLQFFFFQAEAAPKDRVYTCLSRDIVAHETAHAILDGIAPDLYNALTPQSLALHEAVADLTAVMMAAESGWLVTEVLEKTRGAIDDSTIFSSIAPQFGAALGRKYLRQLGNRKTLRDVSGDEPHELSEVLSGALFAVLVRMHNEHRERFAQEDKWKKFGDRKDPVTGEPGDPWFSCSGAAFTAACFRLRNSIFQALEYLPPGEVSFADYGRAILAVDEGGNLNPPFVREWICSEFLQRSIVDKPDELVTKVNFMYEPLDNVDIDDLVNDENVARKFAEDNREFLLIPPGVQFQVRPRQMLRKTYYDANRKEVPAEECLFKVSWPHIESNELDKSISKPREILRGTTLVIDLINKKVRAVLTSDRSDYQCHERDRMFKRLMENGLLARDDRALAPDGSTLDSVVQLDTKSGNLRVLGTACLLHIVE